MIYIETFNPCIYDELVVALYEKDILLLKILRIIKYRVSFKVRLIHYDTIKKVYR